jgi:hypothetical protein
VPQVSEEVFRYPGPRPQFKESAIISLADAVESTSRTLEKPNAARIEQMVNELVANRMADNQLDECDLTIAELAKVKASFVKSLLSMMHSRIKYQGQRESVAKDEPVAEGKVVPMTPRPVTGEMPLEALPVPDERRRKRQARPSSTPAA